MSSFFTKPRLPPSVTVGSPTVSAKFQIQLSGNAHRWANKSWNNYVLAQHSRVSQYITKF